MPEEMPKKDSLDSMEGLPRQDIPLKYVEDAKQTILVERMEETEKAEKTKAQKGRGEQ